MSRRRDPVERAADEGRDLYDVATWEVRGPLDRIASGIYRAIVTGTRAAVVVAAILILLSQFAISGLSAVTRPTVTGLTLLSAVPAFLLVVYVWRADATSSEPLGPLVATFLLGVLFAAFAALLNSLAAPAFASVPVVGLFLFFYLVVAPVEETVKWLAVRLYAYRIPSFDAVVDGAVYGAAAGLGFATIENAIYITRGLESAAAGGGLEAVRQAGDVAGLRALAGPGHVIYSAFAGYYLGLAKFNRHQAGPIVIKGILIAALIHGTYNSLAGPVIVLVTILVPGVNQYVGFLGFVLAFDGLFGYLLYRKLRRYRRAFDSAYDSGELPEGTTPAELTEFE